MFDKRDSFGKRNWFGETRLGKNSDQWCLLGTPLQNEYNEHVKNDKHVNVKIEYNKHVKIDVLVFVEINDKQSLILVLSIPSYNRSRSFKQRTGFLRFHLLLSCTIATKTNDRSTRSWRSIWVLIVGSSRSQIIVSSKLLIGMYSFMINLLKSWLGGPKHQNLRQIL